MKPAPAPSAFALIHQSRLRQFLHAAPLWLALAGLETLAQTPEALKRVQLPDLKPVAMKPNKVNVLTKVENFDIQGRVTGASVSPDGQRLAVLTYTGVWLFDAREKERWFDGAIRWLPTEDSDAEAIALDGESLIVSAGEGDGDLYEIPIAKLAVVRK